MTLISPENPIPILNLPPHQLKLKLIYSPILTGVSKLTLFGGEVSLSKTTQQSVISFGIGTIIMVDETPGETPAREGIVKNSILVLFGGTELTGCMTNSFVDIFPITRFALIL
jgi:hypothetical protein